VAAVPKVPQHKLKKYIYLRRLRVFTQYLSTFLKVMFINVISETDMQPGDYVLFMNFSSWFKKREHAHAHNSHATDIK
jgi:hypothetical protein